MKIKYAKEIYQQAKYFQNKAIVRAKFHLKHDELHFAVPQKEPAPPAHLGQL